MSTVSVRVQGVEVGRVEEREGLGDRLSRELPVIPLYIGVSKRAGKVSYRYSSLLVQILSEGEATKPEVTIRRYVNVEKIEKTLNEVLSRAEGNKIYVKLTYKYKWKPVDETGELRRKLEELFKPLSKFIDTSFKTDRIGFNSKYLEAVDRYSGKFYGRSIRLGNKLLLIGFTEGTLGIYGTMFLIDPDTKTIYHSCTCPWANEPRLGEKTICKHGLALLYYFAPEIISYMKLLLEGELKDYERRAQEFREALDKVFKEIARSPDNYSVAVSNLMYLLFREFANMTRKAEFTTLRLHLPLEDIKKIYDSFEIVEEVRISGEQGSEKTIENIEEALKVLGKTSIFNRIKKMKEILTGLQGVYATTTLTNTLIATSILGSDLNSPPVILGVIGEAGTGKTLTTTMLGELVGTRWIRIEKEITWARIRAYYNRELAGKLRELVRIAEDMGEDKEKVSEALGELQGKLPYYARLGKESLKAIAKRVFKGKVSDDFIEVVEAFIDSEYEVLRRNEEELLRVKGLEARRELLSLLTEYKLIPSVEELEDYNGASIHWYARNTAKGLVVGVDVAVHYLLSTLQPEQLESFLEKLETLEENGYTIRIIESKPGVNKIKLTEKLDIPLMEKTKAIDPLVPGRIIYEPGPLLKGIGLIADEIRRDVNLADSLLTFLSESHRYRIVGNIVFTTDNYAPMMEAETDPEHEAFHSRLVGEVFVPSIDIQEPRERALEEIKKLDKPLVYMDELFILKKLSEKVYVPDEYIEVAHSLPLLFAYKFYLTPPHSVRLNRSIVVVVPRSPEEEEIVDSQKQTLLTPDWEKELNIQRMSERRFDKHVLKIAKALAVAEGKKEVGEEEFLQALRPGLILRLIPVEVSEPHSYASRKKLLSEKLVSYIEEYLKGKTGAHTKILMNTLLAGKEPGEEMVRNALKEWIGNPIPLAVFIDFIATSLASKHREELLKIAGKQFWLKNLVDTIMYYENLDKL